MDSKHSLCCPQTSKAPEYNSYTAYKCFTSPSFCLLLTRYCTRVLNTAASKQSATESESSLYCHDNALNCFIPLKMLWAGVRDGRMIWLLRGREKRMWPISRYYTSSGLEKLQKITITQVWIAGNPAIIMRQLIKKNRPCHVDNSVSLQYRALLKQEQPREIRT
jgi:hypothetical protein